MKGLFQYWRVLDHHQQLHRVQWGVIAGLSLLCVGLWFGWAQSPKRLRIYIPPDLSQGITQQASTIPLPLLHSFALQVWQSLNDWHSEQADVQGHSAYENHLRTYWAYLTPRFAQHLTQEAQQLKQAGKLHRSRTLLLLPESRYQTESVKVLAPGVWRVILVVRLLEQENGMTVKDHRIRYPLRIVRSDLGIDLNPYGLALDGFSAPPVRLKTPE